MKKLVVVVAILIAAYLGLTSWVGSTIENSFPAYINQLAAISQVNVSVDSYERALFSARAMTTVSLKGEGSATEKITLQHTIWHGPLAFGQDSTGSWHLQPGAALIESRLAKDKPATGMFADFLAFLPELGNLQELTTVGYTGNGSISVILPAFKRDFVDNNIKTSVEWHGLTGSENFDSTLSNVNGQLESRGLTITRPDVDIRIGRIDSTFQLNLAEGGLILGQINLNADDISAGPRGLDPVFILKGFQFRNRATQDNDTIGYSVEMVADELLAGGRQFGPLGYEVDFTRLDTATIVDVQRQLQALQLEMTENPEMAGEKALGIYAEALPALLKKSPEIHLNYLRIKSNDGDLWGKGQVVFNGSDAPPITDFASFTAIIDGTSEFQINASLLRSIIREFIAPQFAALRASGQMGDIDDASYEASIKQAIDGQVANLIAQGVLVEEINGNYGLQLAYKNSQALLNGKPLPL